MGRVFEASIRGVAAAAAANYASAQSAANVRARVREIGIFLSAATATSIGLGRPANDGTPFVQSGPVAGQPLDTQDNVAAVVALAATWTTAPTVPGVFLRRITLPAVIGAGVIWTWPADAPLILAPSRGFTLWNFGAGAGAAPDVYVRWEE